LLLLMLLLLGIKEEGKWRVVSEVKEENNRQAIMGEISREVEGPALRRRLITAMDELGR